MATRNPTLGKPVTHLKPTFTGDKAVAAILAAAHPGLLAWPPPHSWMDSHKSRGEGGTPTTHTGSGRHLARVVSKTCFEMPRVTMVRCRFPPLKMAGVENRREPACARTQRMWSPTVPC